MPFALIEKYLSTWWMPVAGNILPALLFVLGMVLRRDLIIDIALIVFYTNLLLTLISGVVLIVKGKWYFIFPQWGISAGLYFFVAVSMSLSPPDYYGAHKEIPAGMEEPLDAPPTNLDFAACDLVLEKGDQPGIYNYYTDYVPSELGYFFVNAFEITSGDRLSGDWIAERSKIDVTAVGASRRQGRFTIYEGDWGDKYGCRIELWYHPQNQSEYKITERHYIVEGWQR